MWGGGPLVGASLPAKAAGVQVASGYTPGDTFSCCCSSVSFSPFTFLCSAASWAMVDKNIHTIGAKQHSYCARPELGVRALEERARNQLLVRARGNIHGAGGRAEWPHTFCLAQDNNHLS
jgi:hypothetical protein